MSNTFIRFGIVVLLFLSLFLLYSSGRSTGKQSVKDKRQSYWFMLYRKSNREFLYQGIPGSKDQSKLVKTMTVKSGIPGERPTPLPQKLGKEYWLITKKAGSADNPETAPYFLTLNIPAPDAEPYGPVPYEECNGQCHWILPGEFGLHGINGDESRLASDNPGSSGCVRHRDEDITFLYNLLKPETEEIRYYIEDI